MLRILPSFFSLVGAAFVFVHLGFASTVPAGESARTESGFLFTRTHDHAELGAAWIDPSNLVWFDVGKEQGALLYVRQAEAERFCLDRQLRLPTRQEMERLMSYMRIYYPGVSTPYYRSQILPHLEEGFWTSTRIGTTSYFSALYPFPDNRARHEAVGIPVRCVLPIH